MGRTIIRLLLIYTFVSLLLSMVVHFSLYFGWSVYETFPTIWLALQVTVFVGLIGTLLQKPGSKLPKDLYSRRAPAAYLLMAILTCVFFFYTPINYFYCAYKLKEGYPDIVD